MTDYSVGVNCEYLFNEISEIFRADAITCYQINMHHRHVALQTVGR